MLAPSGGSEEVLEQAASYMEDIDEAQLAVNPEVSISQMTAIATTIRIFEEVHASYLYKMGVQLMTLQICITHLDDCPFHIYKGHLK